MSSSSVSTPACSVILLLHLAGKLLYLDFDNMLPRYDNQTEISRGHIDLDCGSRQGGRRCLLSQLLSGGMAVLVGVLEDDVAFLYITHSHVGNDESSGARRG